VLPEPFTVIGGHDDDGVLEPSPAPQLFQEPRERFVHVSDLAAIEIGGESFAKRRRGIVRRVDVVEMNESEPGRFPGSGKPFESGSEDARSAPLRDREILERARISVEVVVELEPLVEAEAGVEGEGADEGRRPVTGGAKRLRQRSFRGCQAEGAVVPDAVAGRSR
jgi:hypothetical protein